MDEAFFQRLMIASRQGHLCLRSDEEIPVQGPIVREGHRYYLQRNWMVETIIVDHFRRHWLSPPRDLVDPSRLEMNPQLSPAQAQVIRHAIDRSLTIVSGGPGTGKTFTASQLIQSVVRARKVETIRVKIAAPTGKAADRLAQTIAAQPGLDLESLTLHRLLHLSPGRCRLFQKQSIDTDLIIVDEASMIDASLFAHLLSAIPSGARLVLLGDADQLPPVDGGGVFTDMAELFSIRLAHCHRTSETSLHQLYEAARTGDVKPLYTLLEPMPKDLIAAAESMLELTHPAFSDRRRLICPLRQGPWGVDAMNAALFERVRRRHSGWTAPILITSNDAQLRLYNGSPGVIVGRDHPEEAILADGRTFPVHRLPSFEFAFALSVHKSQGSEFDEVVCFLPPGSEEFGRESLYTALTRAKKSVRLMGSRETLEKMMAIRSQQDNGFKERIESIRS